MGMSAYDYYSMLPKDFAAKVEGYNRKIYYESSNHRKAAFIIILPHVKDLYYDKFCQDYWPLQGDEVKVETAGFDRNISPEVWAAVKQQQKAKEFETILQDHNKKLSNVRRGGNGYSNRRKN